MQLPLCVAEQVPVALKEVARRHLQKKKKPQVLAVESLNTAQIAVLHTHPRHHYKVIEGDLGEVLILSMAQRHLNCAGLHEDVPFPCPSWGKSNWMS